MTRTSARCGCTSRRATTTYPAARYPSVYVIQGYTGHVGMWANREPYRQPFIETADAVFASGEAPGCIVVYVDAWTAYGGSQFVDSPGTGRYHSYLCDEVVPWVDERYRTIPDRDSRAISGKSSGGFGAMITPMLRPDLFGALATHAGDALYELCYVPEFGDAARHLREYDFDILAWWRDFSSRPGIWKPQDESLLTVLGVSACFSALPDGTVELPFDPRTARLRPDDLAALAGLGPGGDGPAPRRRVALARLDLDRCRSQRRLLPGPRGGGLPRRAPSGSESRTTGCTSSCSLGPTPASSTATPWH